MDFCIGCVTHYSTCVGSARFLHTNRRGIFMQWLEKYGYYKIYLGYAFLQMIISFGNMSYLSETKLLKLVVQLKVALHAHRKWL